MRHTLMFVFLLLSAPVFAHADDQRKTTAQSPSGMDESVKMMQQNYDDLLKQQKKLLGTMNNSFESLESNPIPPASLEEEKKLLKLRLEMLDKMTPAQWEEEKLRNISSH